MTWPAVLSKESRGMFISVCMCSVIYCRYVVDMCEGAALTSEVGLVSPVGQQKLHKMFSLCAPLASSMRMVSYVHIRRGRASAARCSRWEKHVCSIPLHNQTTTAVCQPFVGHYIYHNYLHHILYRFLLFILKGLDKQVNPASPAILC